ncbi:transposase [Variovorax saccharolyticus]|uniref:transposase n=1 Tax=Variovorax saccharolyticus TaxID=3053516 RepID=UPI002575EE17|nr:transposase [Variovorax sp. J31P216]MDM0025914.1 transposase [Variovorax sp. J31P216]
MDVNRKQRRRHSAAFKAQVLAACSAPGASVAAVALSFGLNDNLVHQWRRGRGADAVLATKAMAAANANLVLCLNMISVAVKGDHRRSCAALLRAESMVPSWRVGTGCRCAPSTPWHFVAFIIPIGGGRRRETVSLMPRFAR